MRICKLAPSGVSVEAMSDAKAWLLSPVVPGKPSLLTLSFPGIDILSYGDAPSKKIAYPLGTDTNLMEPIWLQAIGIRAGTFIDEGLGCSFISLQ
jgi:hypothetical protein